MISSLPLQLEYSRLYIYRESWVNDDQSSYTVCWHNSESAYLALTLFQVGIHWDIVYFIIINLFIMTKHNVIEQEKTRQEQDKNKTRRNKNKKQTIIQQPQ